MRGGIRWIPINQRRAELVFDDRQQWGQPMEADDADPRVKPPMNGDSVGAWRPLIDRPLEFGVHQLLDDMLEELV